MNAETSLSTPKVQLDPDTKRIKEYTPPKWTKPVSAILTLATILGISLNTKKSEAENTNTDISNTQLGEFITYSKNDNGIPLLEKLKYVNNIDTDAFFIVRVPLKRAGNKDTYATDESEKRASYYLTTPPKSYNLIPQLIFNGKSDNEYEGTNSKQWDSIIKFTIENQKQMGKFSIKETERNKNFEIEFITEDKKLKNNSDYNFTVIAYQDWVNVDAENGERTYRNIFIESPLGATGLNTKIDKNGMATREAKFVRITEENRKQSGFVVLMQNKNTKEIIATGLCRFAELDGIQKPAYFNWNDRNKVTVDYSKTGSPSLPEFEENLGIEAMNLSVEKVKDLKKISFEISQNNFDKSVYEILAGQISPEIKNLANFEFDKKTNEMKLIFKHPFSSEKKINLFTLFEHIQKQDNTVSSGHKISNIRVEDSEGNLIYFDFNDIISTGPNQRITKNNPSDLDSDTWVGPDDEQMILDEFGKIKGDKDWTGETEKCDLNKDGRIDTEDLAEFELGKDGRVENYKRAKIVFETNPGSLPTEIQDEIEKDLKKLQTEVLRAQIDQAYHLLHAE